MASPGEYLERIGELRSEGHTEAADFLTERYRTLKASGAFEAPGPAPRMQVDPVSFASPGQVEKQIREQARELAEAEQLARGRVQAASIPIGTTDRERQLVEEAERSRGAFLEAGRLDEPRTDTGVLPFFRPSFISDEVSYRVRPPTLLGPYDTSEAAEEARGESEDFSRQYPTPYAPEMVEEGVLRTYRDPGRRGAAGEGRDPTLGEEFIEAFAQQPVMSEEQAREAERALARQQAEVDRRINAGERVPFLERNPGSLLGEVFTRPEQGEGIVESPLGASLRSTLGYISALAGEGYFSALGYEVDSEGMPVDPDDIAYQIGKIREEFGIPEVLPVATSGGLLTIPLPGFATRRERGQAEPTYFDPSSGRAVTGEGYLERVVRNVARGRSIGDEFAATPAVRDYYATTFGDPDLAYFAGLVPDLLLPAGPGVALKATAGAGRLIKAGGLEPLSRAFIESTNAAEAASAAARTGADYATGAGARAIEAGQRSRSAIIADALKSRSTPSSGARGVAADYVAAVTPGKASDARINRRVALRVLDRIGLDTDLDMVKNAIRPTSATVSAIKRDVGQALRGIADTAEEAAALEARFARLLDRNIPDDYVLISETVAVPRIYEEAAREQAKNARRGVFLKTSDEVARDLARAAESSRSEEVSDALRSASAAVAADAAEAGLRYGLKQLPKPVRTRIDSALRMQAKESGIPLPKLRETLGSRSPREFAAKNQDRLSESMRRELENARKWDMSNPRVAALVEDAVRIGLEPRIKESVRLSRDLTAAQVALRTAEGSLLANLSTAGLLATPTFRRLAAVGGVLRTETVATARAAQRMKRRGQEALRTASRDLFREVRDTGSVDTALSNLLARYWRAAGETDVVALWERLLGELYGEDAVRRVLPLMRQKKLGPFDREADTLLPTVQTVRAIDRLAAEVGAVRGGTLLEPDFHRAFLRTSIEEGLRKSIAQDEKLREMLASATTLEEATVGTIAGDAILDTMRSLRGRPGAVVDASESGLDQLRTLTKQAALNPEEARLVEVPAEYRIGNTPRYRLYDRAAEGAERMLAEEGTELVRMLEEVPVRQRGEVQRMARDLVEFLLSTGRRNWIQRAEYGFIIPNIPTQLGRLVEMPLVALATIGGANAAAGAGRLAQRATKQLLGRRLRGDSLESVDGIVYDSADLDNLAAVYPLGLSRLETERVGSLAGDLLRDAKKQARGKGFDYVAEYLNPLDRGLFLRFAEALELGFRRSVFEARLIAGDAPEEAANVARRSLLDYDDVPDVIRDKLGRIFATVSNRYGLTREAIGLLKDNPRAATAILKGTREKQRTQDPYQLHGDRLLKSAGLLDFGDEGSFYGPEVPVASLIERPLAVLRGADILASRMRDLYKAGDRLAESEFIVKTTAGDIRRSINDPLIDGVFDVYEAFDGSEPYESQRLGETEPISDEKTFWTYALWAHRKDPDRSSGEWQTFLERMQPEIIPPPSGAESSFPGRWSRQPPEGIPHILDGRDEFGDPIYLALRPGAEGLKRIRLARAITPDRLERLLPLVAAMEKEPTDEQRAEADVFTSPLIPDSLGGMTASVFLEATGVPGVERGTEAQRRAIRDVRETIE